MGSFYFSITWTPPLQAGYVLFWYFAGKKEDRHQPRWGDKISSSTSRILLSVLEQRHCGQRRLRKGGWWRQEEGQPAPSCRCRQRSVVRGVARLAARSGTCWAQQQGQKSRGSKNAPKCWCHLVTRPCGISVIHRLPIPSLSRAGQSVVPGLWVTPAGARKRGRGRTRAAPWKKLRAAGPLFVLLQKLEIANQTKKRGRKDYLMVKMVECWLGKLIVFLSFATFFPLWC